MATTPNEPDEQPTVLRRVARTVATPVVERTPRTLALLVAAAGASTTAPVPVGALAAAALVGVAYELGRGRR